MHGSSLVGGATSTISGSPAGSALTPSDRGRRDHQVVITRIPMGAEFEELELLDLVGKCQTLVAR